MAQDLKHFGVLGMKWGSHKARPAEVRSAIGSAAKTAGTATANSAKAVAKAFQEKHKSRAVEPNMAAINGDFRKATGRDMPKGPVGDRIATALGMRKDRKGVWQPTAETWAKTTTIGIGLGFASFFAEMKLRDFVAKQGMESIVQSAEYAKWLKNG